MKFSKYKSIVLAACAPVFLFGCSKKLKNLSDINPCLNSKLVELNQSGCPSRDSLKQYTFQNKTVYVYQTGSCGNDFTSPVIDENCTIIGHLGGFIGNTKINGEDFSNAVYVKTVWNN